MTANSRLISPFDVLNNYAIHSDGTTKKHEEVFGSKDFALEPCNKNSSHQRLRNQMHMIIHTLSNPNATCNQRKRKLDQYMNGHKFAPTLGLITREERDDQNGMLNEKVDYCSICRHDTTHLGDLDEFIQNPNLIQQGYLKNYPQDLLTISNYTIRTETSTEKLGYEFSKVLVQSLVNGDFHNSSESSHSSSSEKEDIELNLAQNNLSSEDYDTQRPVIPIGPNFQAEVPNWEGPTNIRHQNSDDDLKWLGIQLWPMNDISKNNTKGIGEGTHGSCSCEFPTSIDCVKLHISEARELLKLEIGTTFSSWKFDEMGEDVSKSWTMEEQEKFESLVKLNQLLNGTNLWKLALEHFPYKSMKCMINYYHNVYIPRRLSMETRSCYDVVDSDNEQDENLNNKNDYSSPGRSWLSIFRRQGV